MTENIPNPQLHEQDIPRGTEPSWDDIERFALTFDGYSYHGGLSEASDAAKSMLRAFAIKELLPAETTVSDLRSSLHWVQRKFHHSGWGPEPSPEEMVFCRAVVAKLREKCHANDFARWQLRDKIRGAIFGVAIGDALGATTEFLDPDDVALRHKDLEWFLGGGVWDLKPGETTDDTAMTVAVARGILEKPEDPIESIGKHFLQWRDSDPVDIGGIISAVFDSYEGDWFAAARNVHNSNGQKSAGNGSLMRCIPVALAYADPQTMEEVTRQQSLMTHYDNLASDCCIAYNSIAAELLKPGRHNLKDLVQKHIRETPFHWDYQYGKEPEVPPDGFVGNTITWVEHHLLSHFDFSSVVRMAAMKGGDADTIAAIAGGLAGLYHGFDAIPSKFTSELLMADELLELADSLYLVRTSRSTP